MKPPVDIDLSGLREVFLAETAEHLSVYESALIDLERSPNDRDTAHTIFRVAHTIKGDASMLGYSAMTDFAHALENLLQRLSNGETALTQAMATLLLESGDALRAMSKAADAQIMQAEHRALLDRLEAAANEMCPAASAEKERPSSAAKKDAEPNLSTWSRANGRTLRVGIDKLDRMMDLVGELAIARGRLDSQILQIDGEAGAVLQEANRDLDHFFSELQDLVIQARLVPIGTLFHTYTRAVRDLSIQSGKEVDLRIEGGDAEVDNAVIEQLREPLIHILRNAIDHGVELAEERRRLGKPERGHILLRARHEGASIVIGIADDGTGMPREKLLERARKHAAVEDPERLSNAELQRLIFEPGFTTAAKVTDMSGRGVGLDIVRRAVEGLRGTIDVESVPGEGTELTLRLPLTLAMIAGFGVDTGGESYVIPLEAVVECVDRPTRLRQETDGAGVLSLHGDALPYLSLEEHFHRRVSSAERKQVVVVRHGGGLAGIAVDSIRGECQVVIKPLGPLFKQSTGISGSTILGSGRVALVLDVPSLLRDAIARDTARKEAIR